MVLLFYETVRCRCAEIRQYTEPVFCLVLYRLVGHQPVRSASDGHSSDGVMEARNTASKQGDG